MPSDQERDNAERDRVRHKVRALRQHILVYLIVMGGLLLVNLLSGRPFWVIWPAFGWGIGLAFHAADVFGFEIGREWEDRMVERIMRGRRPPRAPSEPSGPAGGPPAPRA
jgi:hypothetical protein